jgi:hypothetical protein
VAAEPKITKRRVTMSDPRPVQRDGVWEIPGSVTQTAVDYVRPDFLDAYVADAQTRWNSVVVSDEPDAGPEGYHGQTVIPATLDHPEAGTIFPASGITGQQPQAQFSTATLRNARGAGGTALMTHVALQSTAAAATAGTELTGGTYARIAATWAAWSASTSSTTQTHNVPSGATVASLAAYNALTAGTFQAAVDVTSQAFASAGTYQSTLTDTQS